MGTHAGCAGVIAGKSYRCGISTSQQRRVIPAGVELNPLIRLELYANRVMFTT